MFYGRNTALNTWCNKVDRILKVALEKKEYTKEGKPEGRLLYIILSIFLYSNVFLWANKTIRYSRFNWQVPKELIEQCGTGGWFGLSSFIYILKTIFYMAQPSLYGPFSCIAHQIIVLVRCMVSVKQTLRFSSFYDLSLSNGNLYRYYFL